MSPKERALAAAQSTLETGAAALRATLDEIPIVRADIPLLKAGGRSLAFIFLWPGDLLELEDGGKWMQTPVSELLRRRWRSGVHLIRHTRGKPLLSQQMKLSSGRAVTAVFKATGRVLVRDASTGRTLARSVPCKPFELDPLFTPSWLPAVYEVEEGQS